MALNTFKCNHPMPLRFKGLISYGIVHEVQRKYVTCSLNISALNKRPRTNVSSSKTLQIQLLHTRMQTTKNWREHSVVTKEKYTN